MRSTSSTSSSCTWMLRTPVVEERLDRCPDRPARVEHVVDEDDRLALEWEIERRRPHHRLRMTGRAAPANLDVVAVEGDVDRAERGLLAGPLLDQPAQALSQRDAARLDPDERDPGQVRVRLDDLVRDPGQRPSKRVGIEEDPSGRSFHSAHDLPIRAQARRRFRPGSFIRLLSGLTGPG